MTKNALSIIYLLNFLRFGPVVVCYITNHFAVNTDFLFVSLACGFSLFFFYLSLHRSFLTWTPIHIGRTRLLSLKIPKIARATFCLLFSKYKTKKKSYDCNDYLPLLALNFSALTFSSTDGGDVVLHCSRGQSTSYNRQSRFGEDRSELLQLPGSFRTFVY